MKRNNGLDILRAIAIFLVFLHNFWYADKNITFGIISTIGWVGVDLFFTLSGYLIGNQIFTYYKTHNKFSVRIFLIRRFFRILPNYIVIVCLYYFFINFRDSPTLPNIYKELTFVTNINLKSGTAFSYSWSLCIEEQFYLILPFIFLLLAKIRSNKLSCYLIIATFICGIALRSYIWLYYVKGTLSSNTLNITQFSIYQTTIYFFTLCRLDELLIGVAIALFKNYHTPLWNKLGQFGNYFLYFGIVLCSITFYLFYYYHYTFIATTIGYPLLGISFGALVISAIIPNSKLNQLRVPMATTIATMSYAIYMTEKPINHLIITFFKQNHLINSSIHLFLITSILSIIGASLLYFYIELPCLKLRDKLYKKPQYT